MESPSGGLVDTSAFDKALPAGAPSASLIDAALRNVPLTTDVKLDEQTVALFCRRLTESARALAEAPYLTNDADRADAFRYLLTTVAYAIDNGLFAADPLEPMFTPPSHIHMMDWGAANPDGVYRKVRIRDDRSYRLSGRLGNADYLALDLRQGPAVFTITRDDIETDGTGHFELHLGGEPRERNWWAIPPGAIGILTREFFRDWLRCERSALRIECIDGEVALRPEQHSRRVAAEFEAIGEWIRYAGIEYWIERSLQTVAQTPNAFATTIRSDTKLPTTGLGWWELAPHEAMIIELPRPEVAHWGLQLASSMWRTLDYANRVTSINGFQAAQDDDGAFRLVLSHVDPGIYNWLDTTGLERGVLIHRFSNSTPPRTWVVDVADVARELPDARPCTPDERRAQIAERRDGVARLVCD